ncbi:MAG: HEPN domain-containing protein, partial [Ktedonobacteraceae bacterium]
ALGKGIYTIAIYSAEMCVEIALKGVLEALGADIPKAHRIADLARMILEEKRRLLPKEFVDREQFILATMDRLAELRPIMGYAHEGNVDSKTIQSDAKRYFKEAEEIIGLCDKAIAHIDKKR